jgi:S-adenosylmethionine:tRNA ribosyltransferase-isomerase
MKKSDFLYDLPSERIAQYPRKKGESKLMVLHRKTGEIEHKKFCDILDYVKLGDCLAVNNSKVIPARLKGSKVATGGEVEVLLVEKKADRVWKAMVSPGKRARISDEIIIGDNIRCVVEKIVDGTGERILRFETTDDNILKYGETPLPPYINRPAESVDIEGYQTVYAREEGSVAAPTAGLHFNEKILDKLKKKCGKVAEVTLHVGPGTFRPVRTENIENHKMESEFFIIDKESVSIINNTKENGGSVLAVGTTTVRSLESASIGKGKIKAKKGRTDIFIYPPYEFKIVDRLLTNFHLPGSTLIMLVSAFASREMILDSYREAIKEEYMFYSYGDAMLIL